MESADVGTLPGRNKQIANISFVRSTFIYNLSSIFLDTTGLLQLVHAVDLRFASSPDGLTRSNELSPAAPVPKTKPAPHHASKKNGAKRSRCTSNASSF